MTEVLLWALTIPHASKLSYRYCVLSKPPVYVVTMCDIIHTSLSYTFLLPWLLVLVTWRFYSGADADRLAPGSE